MKKKLCLWYGKEIKVALNKKSQLNNYLWTKIDFETLKLPWKQELVSLLAIMKMLNSFWSRKLKDFVLTLKHVYGAKFTNINNYNYYEYYLSIIYIWKKKKERKKSKMYKICLYRKKQNSPQSHNQDVQKIKKIIIIEIYQANVNRLPMVTDGQLFVNFRFIFR